MAKIIDNGMADKDHPMFKEGIRITSVRRQEQLLEPKESKVQIKPQPESCDTSDVQIIDVQIPPTE